MSTNPQRGAFTPDDLDAPSGGADPFDQLDSEFKQSYGRPLRFTGRDTPTHIRLHGAGQARDIGVKELSGDELKFILKRGPELGLNLRDYSKASPHTTSTGVRITGPHVHAQMGGTQKPPAGRFTLADLDPETPDSAQGAPQATAGKFTAQDLGQESAQSPQVGPAVPGFPLSPSPAQRSVPAQQALPGMPGTPSLNTEDVQTQASRAIEQMVNEPDLQERIAANQTPEAQAEIARYHKQTQARAKQGQRGAEIKAPQAPKSPTKTESYQSQVDTLDTEIKSLSEHRNRLSAEGHADSHLDSVIYQKALERSQFQDQLAKMKNGTAPKVADLKKQLEEIQTSQNALISYAATTDDEEQRQKFYDAANERHQKVRLLQKYIDIEESGGVAHPALLQAAMKPMPQEEKLPAHLKGLAANLTHAGAAGVSGIADVLHGAKRFAGIGTDQDIKDIEDNHAMLVDLAKRGGSGFPAEATRIIGGTLAKLPMYAAAAAAGSLGGAPGEVAAFGLLGAAETAGQPDQPSLGEIGKSAALSAAMIPIYKAAGMLPNRTMRVAAAGAGGAGLTAAGGGNTDEILQSALITGILAFPGGSKSPFALNPDKPPKYVKPVLNEMADYLVKEHGATPEQAAAHVADSWAKVVEKAEAEGVNPLEIRKKARGFMEEYAKSQKDAQPVEEAPIEPGDGSQALQTTASVPFMVTKATRSRLVELGYSRAEIDAMKPDEALRKLDEGIRVKEETTNAEKIRVDEGQVQGRGVERPGGEGEGGEDIQRAAETGTEASRPARRQEQEGQVTREEQARKAKEAIAKRREEVPAKEPEEVQPQTARKLKKLADRYENEEGFTEGSLVEEVESLGSDVPKALRKAVSKYRKAQREDREVYGQRSDIVETAEDHFMETFRAHVGEGSVKPIESQKPLVIPQALRDKAAALDKELKGATDDTGRERIKKEISANNIEIGQHALGTHSDSKNSPSPALRSDLAPAEAYKQELRDKKTDQKLKDLGFDPAPMTREQKAETLQENRDLFRINRTEADRMAEKEREKFLEAEEAGKVSKTEAYKQSLRNRAAERYKMKPEHAAEVEKFKEASDEAERIAQEMRKAGVPTVGYRLPRESVEDFWARSMADTAPARRVPLEEFKREHEKALREGIKPTEAEIAGANEPIERAAPKEQTVLYKGKQVPLSELPKGPRAAFERLIKTGQVKATEAVPEVKAEPVEKRVELYVPPKGEVTSPQEAIQAKIEKGEKVSLREAQDYARSKGNVVNHKGSIPYWLNVADPSLAAKYGKPSEAAPAKAAVKPKSAKSLRVAVVAPREAKKEAQRLAREAAIKTARDSQVQQALADWNSGRAYIDNAGNYRVKQARPNGQAGLTSSGPIAPWNKAAKTAFKSSAELHAAAQGIKPAETPVPVQEAAKVAETLPPETAATIDRIVELARKPIPNIVLSRHGKGFVFEAKDGTTYGTRAQTKQELIDRFNAGQDKEMADLRVALAEKSPSDLQHASDYWLGQHQRKEMAIKAAADIRERESKPKPKPKPAPKPKPVAAPVGVAKPASTFQRTTPAAGTSERAKLQIESDRLEHEIDALNKKRAELKEKARKSKSYEAQGLVEKRIEKIDADIDKLQPQYKEVRHQLATAHREDVVQTGDEANRIAAQELLKPTGGSYEKIKALALVEANLHVGGSIGLSEGAAKDAAEQAASMIASYPGIRSLKDQIAIEVGASLRGMARDTGYTQIDKMTDLQSSEMRQFKQRIGNTEGDKVTEIVIEARKINDERVKVRKYAEKKAAESEADRVARGAKRLTTALTEDEKAAIQEFQKLPSAIGPAFEKLADAAALGEQLTSITGSMRGKIAERGLFERGLITDKGKRLMTARDTLRDGLPMSEYRPGSGNVPAPGLGWYTNEVNGAKWYSDGHFMMKGEPPKGALAERNPDMARMMPEATAKMMVVAPIGFSQTNTEQPEATWFNPNIAAQSYLVDHIAKKYKDIEWRVTNPENGDKPVYGYSKGEIVAVLMPLRIKETPSVIAAIAQGQPAEPKAETAKPKKAAKPAPAAEPTPAAAMEQAVTKRIRAKQKSPAERTKQKIREQSGAPKLYQEADEPKRMRVKAGERSDAYSGEHTAPMSDSGNPGYDVSIDVYPEDIYGPNGPRYYGDNGGDWRDHASIAIIRSMRNHPDKPIRIYRAVPKDVKGAFNVGDWVTINRAYAKEHGQGALRDEYRIISKVVHARDIWTNGDSLHEWGYDPQEMTPARERPEKYLPGYLKNKLFQDAPKTFAEIALPDDIKQPLLEIAQSFMREGKSDYDALVKEYETLLGGDFEYVISELPAIVQHAADLHAQYQKNLSDLRAIVTANPAEFTDLGMPTEAELQEAARLRSQENVDEANARSNEKQAVAQTPKAYEGNAPAGNQQGAGVAKEASAKSVEPVVPTDHESFKRALVSEWGYGEEVAHHTASVADALAESFARDLKATDPTTDVAKAKRDFFSAIRIAGPGETGAGSLEQSLRRPLLPPVTALTANRTASFLGGREASKDASAKRTSTGVAQEGFGPDDANIPQQNPATLERVTDSTNVANIEAIRDLAQAPAFLEKGLRGLDVPSQRNMIGRVVRAIRQFEIQDVVVKTIPVSVVNDLAGVEFPSQVSLHDPSVLKSASSINADHSVSLRSDTADAIVRIIAGLTTKGQTARMPLVNQPPERSSAVVASGGKPQGGLVGPHTGDIAESAVGLAGRNASELSSTIGADTIDQGHGVSPLASTVSGASVSAGAPFTLAQNELGSTEFLRTGEAILRAGTAVDFSTGSHELFHGALPLIARLANQENAPATLKTAINDIVAHSGFDSLPEYLRLHSRWVDGSATQAERDAYRKGSERGARSFEGFLRSGEVSNPALKTAFAKFKEWLSRIYQRLRPDMELTDRVRRAFDRILGSESEKAHAANGDTKPGVDTVRVDQVRTRATPGTLREYGIDAADSTYYVKPNAVSVQVARDLISEHGVEGALRIWEADKVASAESTATGMALISEFLRKAENAETVGETAKATAFREQVGRVVEELSSRQTAAGQTVQATNTIASFAPERVVLTAKKIKKSRGLELTEKEIKEGADLGKRVGAKEKAVTKLEGEIADIREAKKKTKPANWQSRLARLEADTRARLGLLAQAGGKLFQRNEQTETEAFRKWFGESKVVDEKGEPLVVYHGTSNKFEAFDPRAQFNYHEEDQGQLHFTNSKEEAKRYGEYAAKQAGTGKARVMPVFLSLQNPYEVEVHGDTDPATHYDQEVWYTGPSASNPMGHDGIIIRNVDHNEAVYIVFEPTQIKSVFNRGTFDPNSSNILFQDGPTDEVILGAAKLARKLNRSDWEAEMVADFGEGIRPTLDAVRRQSAEMIRDMRREDRERAEPASRSLLAETFDEIRDLQREASEEIKAQVREEREFAKQNAKQQSAEARAALKEDQRQRREDRAAEAATNRAKLKELRKQEAELQKAEFARIREERAESRKAATLDRRWDAGIKRDAAANPTDQVAVGAEMLAGKPMRVFDWQRAMRERFGAEFKDAPGMFAQAYAKVKTARGAALAMGRLGRAPSAFSDAQIEELENRRKTATKEASQARMDLANYFENLQGGLPWRVARTIVDLTGIPRSVMTSYDLSAAGRQSFPISLAHPNLAAKAFEMQWNAIRSAAGSEDVTTWLAQHPRRNSAMRNGLNLSRLTGERPEMFPSRLANKIPGVGRSEHGYTAYNDGIRMLAFDQAATQAEQAFGFTEDTNPKFYKDLATLVNLQSGYGKLPKFLQSAAPILNNVFFSTRLWSSRIELAFPIRFLKAEPHVRALAYKDLFKTYAFMGTMMGLAGLLGAHTEWDPDDADFLYTRFGNTRYDFSGGIRGPLKFAGRLGLAALRKAQGRDSEGRGLVDIIGQEARNKLAPVPGAVISAATGKKPTGEPTTAGNEALGLVTPMVGRDAYEGWLDAGGSDIKKWMRGEEKQFKTGFSGAAKTGIPSFFGISTQTYTERVPIDVRRQLRAEGKSFNRVAKKEGESQAAYDARLLKEDAQSISAIRDLKNDPQYQKATRDGRKEMLRSAITHTRKGVEGEELDFDISKDSTHKALVNRIKGSAEYKAMDEDDRRSLLQSFGLKFGQKFGIPKDTPEAMRTSRAETKRKLLELLTTPGPDGRSSLEREVDRLLERAATKKAA